MKKTAFLILAVTTALFATSCRSPKGNVNYMSIGKGRPTLVQ